MAFLLNSQSQGVSSKNEQSSQTPWRGAQCSCIGCIGLRPALRIAIMGRGTKKVENHNRVHLPPTFLFKYTFHLQKTVVTCKSSAYLAIAIVKLMLSPYSL